MEIVIQSYFSQFYKPLEYVVVHLKSWERNKLKRNDFLKLKRTFGSIPRIKCVLCDSLRRITADYLQDFLNLKETKQKEEKQRHIINNTPNGYQMCSSSIFQLRNLPFVVHVPASLSLALSWKISNLVDT